jgi:hypothetical protein
MKSVILVSFFLFIVFCFLTNAQNKIEEDIEISYQNAKKGIYWALDNIPEKKGKTENDLIANDKLYARVKLEKEIFGIKIESTGYYNTNSISILIYKSYDNLVKEGYLKKIPSE